jgi:hypothetical protein
MSPSPLLPGEVAELRRLRPPGLRMRRAVQGLALAVFTLVAVLCVIGVVDAAR